MKQMPNPAKHLEDIRLLLQKMEDVLRGFLTVPRPSGKPDTLDQVQSKVRRRIGAPADTVAAPPLSMATVEQQLTDVHALLYEMTKEVGNRHSNPQYEVERDETRALWSNFDQIVMASGAKLPASQNMKIDPAKQVQLQEAEIDVLRAHLAYFACEIYNRSIDGRHFGGWDVGVERSRWQQQLGRYARGAGVA